MKIWVSSLSKVHDVAARVRPSLVVSLLSPGDVFPRIEGLAPARHHRVHLHDIREPQDGMLAPGVAHVEGLVRFLSGWSPDDALLVHCWAGISRSTATAFIAACLHDPGADEREIASALRAASPTAWPNSRIVAIADDIMGRGGRMSAAVASLPMASLAEEAIPFSIPAPRLPEFRRRADLLPRL